MWPRLLAQLELFLKVIEVDRLDNLLFVVEFVEDCASNLNIVFCFCLWEKILNGNE